jgi:hypothetical protein
MPAAQLSQLIQAYSLEQWALAVVNSSRNYIRSISDQLDEKRKVIFSSHLKQFDQNPPQVSDQSAIRQDIAQHAEVHFFSKVAEESVSTNQNEESAVNEKSA